MSTIKKQITDILERLDEERQKAVLAFVCATLAEKNIPKWRDRNTLYPNQKISPADWIIMHYDPLNKTGMWGEHTLNKSDIRQIDRELYQAYATQQTRWKKQGKEIPIELLMLEDNSTERVEKELAEHQITDPKDAFRLFPNDRDKADRLYQAAKRRLGL